MVCFVWLAWLIGPSFLAGVFALFISVPCQATVLKVYFKAQIERLKVTDQRIKLTNEMVQGMRVVSAVTARHERYPVLGTPSDEERLSENTQVIAVRDE